MTETVQNSSDGSRHIRNFNPEVFGKAITGTPTSVNQASLCGTNDLRYPPVPSTAGNYGRGH